MAEADTHEAEWIRRIQRDRSHAASTALVERYYGEIGRYLRRQLRDHDSADDLAQEVFIAVLAHIDRFDARRASFRTWLFRIATNKLIDHLRSLRRRGQPLSLDEFDPADSSDVADWVADADLARRALTTLRSRSPRVQQIVGLKVFGGCTFGEIGAVLGIPEATAKTTYYRGLASVRKDLEHE